MEFKSSAERILLVACLLNARGTSEEEIPQPSSVILIRETPPLDISTVICFASASMEFSISSFTTEAGLSTTSPAAISSEISFGSSLICGIFPPPCRFY